MTKYPKASRDSVLKIKLLVPQLIILFLSYALLKLFIFYFCLKPWPDQSIHPIKVNNGQGIRDCLYVTFQQIFSLIHELNNVYVRDDTNDRFFSGKRRKEI